MLLFGLNPVGSLFLGFSRAGRFWAGKDQGTLFVFIWLKAEASGDTVAFSSRP